jgi:hypothetical protein
LCWSSEGVDAVLAVAVRLFRWVRKISVADLPAAERIRPFFETSMPVTRHLKKSARCESEVVSKCRRCRRGEKFRSRLPGS